jgi:hypothetical protein
METIDTLSSQSKDRKSKVLLKRNDI